MSDYLGAPARQVVLQDSEEDQLLDFAYSVRAGLSETPRSIPCRFLYDAKGAELFERICELPEYYLTRAETEILREKSEDIRSITGPVTLIELGSGTSVKTDHLLSAYVGADDRVRYVPVDVSEPSIRMATENIRSRHPTVNVEGIVGTYEGAFPKFVEHSPSMVIFLGSTIGNLEPDEADRFWLQIEENLSPGDCFLLGADLVKDVDVLEAAYNDSQGVTAEFMKNVFARMNRELGSDVDIAEIEHIAEYNTVAQQVEHLVKFSSDQEVYIEPLESTFQIEAGESVLLEVSRKFVVDDLIEYVADYGLDILEVYTDPQRRFADLLLQKR